MVNKAKTTDAVEILNQVVFKNDPERLKAIEHYRLNSEVAGLIYNLRIKAGLSQAELAHQIHTTQSVISRLEDADYEGHSLSMLAKVAAALNHRLVLSAKHLDIPEIKSKTKHMTGARKIARA